MENNAIINSRLIDLLDGLDARTTINIFVQDGTGQRCIQAAKVYEILSNPDFLKAYKNYEIIGLNLGLVSNILITQEA